MSDFLGRILDAIEYLWPFRVVKIYERGVFYIWGFVWRNVGPGLKVFVPFFMQIDIYLVCPDVRTLPRQDITLKDGRLLTFQVAVAIEVIDLVAADTKVANYIESTQEISMGIIADRLMEIEPSRFDSENRGRLIGGLKQSINAALSPFGCRCTELWFTQFALGARPYRVFTDQAAGIFDG